MLEVHDMTRGWVSLILADQWELCNSHHPCYQMFERWLLEEWFLPIQSSLKKLTWNFLNKHAGRIFPLQVFQISGVFFRKTQWVYFQLRLVSDLHGSLGGSQVFNQAAWKNESNEFVHESFRRSMSSLLETNLSNLPGRGTSFFEATFKRGYGIC